MEDFISIHNLSLYEFNQILDMTPQIKEHPKRFQNKLKNKILAMIFEKPPLRTRMTSEIGSRFHLTNDPYQAALEADAIYTDVWVSMGQEEEKKARAKIFAPFQVSKKLMDKAKAETVFMHCLPAHRGEEVTDEVIASSQSIVYDQAENRLHVQKVIMLLLLEKK